MEAIQLAEADYFAQAQVRYNVTFEDHQAEYLELAGQVDSLELAGADERDAGADDLDAGAGDLEAGADVDMEAGADVDFDLAHPAGSM